MCWILLTGKIQRKPGVLCRIINAGFLSFRNRRHKSSRQTSSAAAYKEANAGGRFLQPAQILRRFSVIDTSIILHVLCVSLTCGLTPVRSRYLSASCRHYANNLKEGRESVCANTFSCAYSAIPVMLGVLVIVFTITYYPRRSGYGQARHQL